MQFKSLRIQKQETWQKNFGGQIAGEIELESPNGKVAILLNPEQCARILQVVADAAHTTAQAAADAMINSMHNIGSLELESGLDKAALESAQKRYLR